MAASVKPSIISIVPISFSFTMVMAVIIVQTSNKTIAITPGTKLISAFQLRVIQHAHFRMNGIRKLSVIGDPVLIIHNNRRGIISKRIGHIGIRCIGDQLHLCFIEMLQIFIKMRRKNNCQFYFPALNASSISL